MPCTNTPHARCRLSASFELGRPDSVVVFHVRTPPSTSPLHWLPCNGCEPSPLPACVWPASMCRALGRPCSVYTLAYAQPSRRPAASTFLGHPPWLGRLSCCVRTRRVPTAVGLTPLGNTSAFFVNSPRHRVARIVRRHLARRHGARRPLLASRPRHTLGRCHRRPRACAACAGHAVSCRFVR